jgi:tetraacyldisaccharide 4'-kinase
MTIVYQRAFRDHHRYTVDDLLAVIKDARLAGAEAVVITEKDAVNLAAAIQKDSHLPIYAAEIEFRCEEEVALKSLILRIARGGATRGADRPAKKSL